MAAKEEEKKRQDEIDNESFDDVDSIDANSLDGNFNAESEYHISEAGSEYYEPVRVVLTNEYYPKVIIHELKVAEQQKVEDHVKDIENGDIVLPGQQSTSTELLKASENIFEEQFSEAKSTIVQSFDKEQIKIKKETAENLIDSSVDGVDGGDGISGGE